MSKQPYSQNSIRIIQHNCNRSSFVLNTLLDYAAGTADILLLQEPGLLDEPYTTTHPLFELFLPPKNNRKHNRTAAYVAKHHPHLTCSPRTDLSNDPDLQILEISTPAIPPTFIFNIYNEHEGTTNLYTIPRTLINTPIPDRCIIAGDMNAHHPLWNSAVRSPKRAQELVSLMEENNLVLLNKMDKPTYHFRTGKGTSVLDLCFVTPCLEDVAVNWAVDKNACTGSDHETIRFQLLSQDSAVDNTPILYKYNWDKTDWTLFNTHLQSRATETATTWQQLHQHPSTANLDRSAEFLRDLLLECTQLSTPVLDVCSRSKRWWNKDLKELRANMSRAKRRWRNEQNPTNHMDFKAARNTYFHSVRKAKSTTWNTFLEQAKGKDIFTAMKYVKPRKTQRTPPLSDGQNTFNTFQQKASLFRQKLFPPPPAMPTQTTNPSTQQLEWHTFTPSEINKAISTSAARKAPGPDGLPFACIQQAYSAIPEYFNTLYSALGKVGYHPRCWREATTVIIAKHNKPDYTNPKAYRPVALLNCLGKVLEKLMAGRLSYMAEKFGLLHKDQIGGRPQRSAVDAVMALTHEIEDAKRHRQIVSTLFMDVKGAFDNVSRDRLLHTMKELGIPTQVTTWVSHFLTFRTTALAFDGQREDLLPVQTGIPQGSPASPILFLLYIRPLFDVLNQKLPLVWTPSYMDDVALVVRGKTKQENARVMEQAAAICFEWAESNAVLFDDAKTEMMHFHTRRDGTTQDDEMVTLPNGTTVTAGTQGKSEEVVRWVGIWLDRKLSFKHHVNLKVAGATKALGALANLSNTQKGLSPAAVRQLYQSCIIPVCDFGAEIWWRGQKSYSSKLDTVQNRALKKILGAFNTTPIGALQNEAAIPATSVRLNHLHRKYALRVINMPEPHPIRARCPSSYPPFYQTEEEEESPRFTAWDDDSTPQRPYRTHLISILSTLRTWINRTTEVETYSTTAVAPWVETLVSTSIAKLEKKDEADAHNKLVAKLKQDKQTIIAYTDGSMLDGKVGAGAVIEGEGVTAVKRKWGMGERAEVYDAELLGIEKAAQITLKMCQASGLENRKIWIFTDNQAAVNRVSNLKPAPGQDTAIEVASISKQLQQLGTSLHIQWVPGHFDVEGNEQADKLAKEGTQITTRQNTTTTLSFLKRVCREARKREWRTIWESDSTNRGRNYDGFFKHKPDQIFATNNRPFVSAVTQLRTGHGYFRSYLHRIPNNQINTPTCFCNTNQHQTPKHLILKCPKFRKARSEMQSIATQIPKLRLHTLLYTNSGLQGLEHFFKATGIGTQSFLPQPTHSSIPNTQIQSIHGGFGTILGDEEEHADGGNVEGED